MIVIDGISATFIVWAAVVAGIVLCMTIACKFCPLCNSGK